MRRLFARTTAILLIAVMMLTGLAACTAPAADGETKAEAEEAAEPAADDAAEPAADGPVGKQIETFGLDPNDPVEFTCFVNFTWYPIDTWEGIIAEEITRLTGVSMDLTIAVDSQQLGLLIASGDMPDLVFTQDQLSALSSSDVCYDIGGLIEEYNTGWEMDQMSIANALSFSQEADEGKYFTRMTHFATDEDWAYLDEINMGAAMTGSVIYRHDIYEELGSPALETLDDVKNLLIAVRDAYPDMRPLTLDPVTWKTTPFKQWFGIGNGADFLEQEDGSWIPFYEDQRWYDAMKYVNGLYRENLFNPDVFSMDGTEISAMIEAGSVFASTTGTQRSCADRNMGLWANNPDAELWEMPWVGDTEGAYDVSIGWAGLFITKNCKDPEKAVRYLQFIHSEDGAKLSQWGREGVEYTLNEQGQPVFSDEWIEATANGTLDQVYNTSLYMGGSKVYEAIGRCYGLDDSHSPNNATLRKCFKNKPWIVYAKPVDGSDEKNIYDKLFDGNSGYIPQAEIKLITAETDEQFEEIYAQVFVDAEAIGAKELTEYYDAAIKEAMVLYGVAE